MNLVEEFRSLYGEMGSSQTVLNHASVVAASCRSLTVGKLGTCSQMAGCLDCLLKWPKLCQVEEDEDSAVKSVVRELVTIIVIELARVRPN